MDRETDGWSASARYGAAVAFTGASLLVTTGRLHAFEVPAFIVFVANVAIVHIVFGVGPACVALLLSSLASIYCFPPPHVSWSPEAARWPLPIAYGAATVNVALARAHGVLTNPKR